MAIKLSRKDERAGSYKNEGRKDTEEERRKSSVRLMHLPKMKIVNNE